jgi:hypothetical protein
VAGVGMDEFELRSELAQATDDALDLGSQLATACIDGPLGTPRVAGLAREFLEKRAEVRRLRRAVAVEVAG